uniref:Pheromone binding protein 12 n=1 Tax=Cyrtotrachelus buqueti TaxID=1892066 RepID=A0A1L3KPR9_9CUCU|nr:pheromone binding protein 12 [Cyrtotrachelus buqueti]
MLENASQELRDQRKIMQEERQKLEYKKKNSKQSQKGNKSQRVMMYNTRLSSRADTDSSVIEIQDSSESSSSDTSNYNSSNSEFDYDSDFDLSENVMIGLPDAYYGGYGRCYSCGERGHWANGCPFR